MHNRPKEVAAFLPELARTDRPISEVVRCALVHWSSGEGMRATLGDECSDPGHDAAESLEADAEAGLRGGENPGCLACYVSDEDNALCERLSDSLEGILLWAVTSGWAWRREGS